ncbi:putative ATP/GTP binding protein [Streptomyces viridochromogenes Tue57]|uniref:Putative ATP/GTP binding protein n=1 Tax=Streptomyces viridochromogenes Tue57 TaxID=1160705 RepID=L8P1B8_STRVR|nr:putative ATP/GTP binding protein [Streptomyces viridochromogenes Tue57]
MCCAGSPPTRWHAAPDTHGGPVTRVGSGTVNDPSAKTSHEVDVAAHGEDGDGREALLGIGEAKWNDVMGAGHLERLRRIRTLLTTRGTATEATRPHCFSGAGFTDELHHLARNDPAIQLIDLTRLCHGE